MTTNRIYKTRLTKEEALLEIKNNSGTQFDPSLTELAIKALSQIDLNINTTQMPFGEIEKERFAYFYKDQTTGLYNQFYLDLMLLQNQTSKKYNFLNLISLHKFSAYNQKHSWQKGDELLKTIGTYLLNNYTDSLIFRFEGDDFVLLSQTTVLSDISYINTLVQSYDESLFVTIKEFDIDKKELYSISDFENELRETKH